MVVQGKQDETVEYIKTSEKCKHIKKCILYYPTGGDRETLFVVKRMKVLKKFQLFMQMLWEWKRNDVTGWFKYNE